LKLWVVMLFDGHLLMVVASLKPGDVPVPFCLLKLVPRPAPASTDSVS
jgi:hypothetical protein